MQEHRGSAIPAANLKVNNQPLLNRYTNDDLESDLPQLVNPVVQGGNALL